MHIGMSAPFRFLLSLDSVYGHDVAVDGLFINIIKKSKAQEFSVFLSKVKNRAIMQKMIEQRIQNILKDAPTKYIEIIPETNLIKKYNGYSFDILHNVSNMYIPLVSYRNMLLKRPIPVTHTVHCISDIGTITDHLMMLIDNILPFDSYICTSRAVKKSLEHLFADLSESLQKKYCVPFRYAGRLDHIPLAVDTNRFTKRDKRTARDKVGLPQDDFIILWIGRLSAFDKADLFPLLLMFRRLLRQNQTRKIRLVLAGHTHKNLSDEPYLKEYVQALGIERNVTILLNHNISQREWLFSCADVFVSPIDCMQETFGLTPIEAMSCGVPQVVSDWDGYKDTVVDGVTGFRIPTYWSNCDNDAVFSTFLPSDISEKELQLAYTLGQSVVVDLDIFQNKLQILIDNAALREKMSQQSMKRAKDVYDYSVIVPMYDELWSELSAQAHAYWKENEFMPNKSVMLPNYSKVFVSYPSAFLKDDTCLYITDEGREFLDGQLKIPPHFSFESYIIDPKPRTNILRTIAQLDAFQKHKGNGISIKQILKKYALDQNDTDFIRRTVLWLLKQGLVRIVDPIQINKPL